MSDNLVLNNDLFQEVEDKEASDINGGRRFGRHRRKFFRKGFRRGNKITFNIFFFGRRRRAPRRFFGVNRFGF